MRPLVSIIIPVYNRKQFLEECILSCAKQTYSNIEIIIIDDGSTEDIEQEVGRIIQLHNLSNLKYFKQPNSNGNIARNNGFKKATGQYIQFLDSDDVLAPQKIETQLHLLTENPELDMVYCLDEFFNVTPGDKKILWNKPGTVNDIDRYLYDDPVWHTNSPLWKHSTLEKMGLWDENIICWQDWEFHLRLLIQGIRYRHIPQVLNYIREHNSINSTNLGKLIDRETSKLSAANRILGLLQQHHGLTRARKMFLLRYYLIQIENMVYTDIYASRNLVDTICNTVINNTFPPIQKLAFRLLKSNHKFEALRLINFLKIVPAYPRGYWKKIAN